MKKKKIILTILSVIVVTSLFSAILRYPTKRGRAIGNKQGFVFQYKNEKFSFNFMQVDKFTYEETAKLPYQLPDSLLSQFSTKELILFCGDHPNLAVSRYGGTKHNVFQHFNGFKELIGRDEFFDRLVTLLKDYIKKMDNYNMGKNKMDKKDKKDKRDKYRTNKINYFLGMDLLYTKELFDHLNKNQKIQYFKFLKTLLKDPQRFSPMSATRFLYNSYPEDSNIWGHCILTPFSSIAHGGDYEIKPKCLEKYFNQKIEQLKRSNNE